MSGILLTRTSCVNDVQHKTTPASGKASCWNMSARAVCCLCFMRDSGSVPVAMGWAISGGRVVKGDESCRLDACLKLLENAFEFGQAEPSPLTRCRPAGAQAYLLHPCKSHSRTCSKRISVIHSSKTF